MSIKDGKLVIDFYEPTDEDLISFLFGYVYQNGGVAVLKDYNNYQKLRIEYDMDFDDVEQTITLKVREQM